jgi:carbon-monoxide dehydrogenase medium subunit
VGASLDPSAIADAAREAAAALTPVSDHRASADYRRGLIEVLARRSLEQAADTDLRESK